MMAGSDRELEVKFHLPALAGLENRLHELGAELTAPRVFEVNLRFDTPGGTMTQARQVLRLRQDAETRITYKGPGSQSGGVTSRVELEVQVSDFATARKLFEALGYQVVVIYEKFRTTYRLDDVLVTLDEMPYGSFAEIEGPTGESIHAAAVRLGLDWDRRIFESYLALFEKLRGVMRFEFRDLNFENFRGLDVDLNSIGI